MSGGPTKDATRQAECLRLIVIYARHWQESPTRAQLAKEMSISKVSVHLLIGKMVDAGLLVTRPGQHRNIGITPLGVQVADGKVPDFFSVAALKGRKQ